MRRYIKKTAKLLILSSFVFANGFCMNISAEETDTPYYTNFYGVELTKDEYDNLLKGFGKTTLYYLKQEIVDLYKDEENLTCNSMEVWLDENSNPVKPTSLVSPLATDIWYSEYSYPTRKLEVTISPYGQLSSKRLVSVTNTWIILPSVRSFDVLAVRAEGEYEIFTDKLNTYGSQIWDGNEIEYNTEKCSSYFKILSDGVGLSMNLSDDATKSIECNLTVCFGSGADDLLAVGTYQHAIATSSLFKSKQYTIDILGDGGVVDFYSTVEDLYEQGAGLIVQDVE